MIKGKSACFSGGVLDTNNTSFIFITRTFNYIEPIRFTMFASIVELLARKSNWAILETTSHRFNLAPAYFLTLFVNLEQVKTGIVGVRWLPFRFMR